MSLFGGKKCMEWKNSCARIAREEVRNPFFTVFSLNLNRERFEDCWIFWIFVVAQVLHRFEHLLKSSSDGHGSFLYVSYASSGNFQDMY